MLNETISTSFLVGYRSPVRSLICILVFMYRHMFVFGAKLKFLRDLGIGIGLRSNSQAVDQIITCAEYDYCDNTS
jgi:hypothetical protein